MKKHYSTQDVDWQSVAALFAEVGWGERNPIEIRSAFEKSSYVIFLYQDHELIAFGRTTDDGRYYALISDVVVKPGLQGAGLGREIVTYLKDQLKSYKFVTLTSAVGKNEFYEKMGWKRQNSAYIWPNSDEQAMQHTHE